MGQRCKSPIQRLAIHKSSIKFDGVWAITSIYGRQPAASRCQYQSPGLILPWSYTVQHMLMIHTHRLSFRRFWMLQMPSPSTADMRSPKAGSQQVENGPQPRDRQALHGLGNRATGPGHLQEVWPLSRWIGVTTIFDPERKSRLQARSFLTSRALGSILKVFGVLPNGCAYRTELQCTEKFPEPPHTHPTDP